MMARIAATRVMRDEIRRMGEDQCRIRKNSTDPPEMTKSIGPRKHRPASRESRSRRCVDTRNGANFNELTDQIHATRQDATQAELEQHGRLAEIEQRHDAEHTAIRESWNERVADSRSGTRQSSNV